MEIYHLESPSPNSLGGFKGMGRAAPSTLPAVIASAVTDALKPFGIHVNETPVTPDWILSRLPDPATAPASKGREAQ